MAPAIGPTLGGYIVEYLNWRLIFYINVPIGLLGAAAAWFILPRMGPTRTHRFDWWGFVSIGYGLFALLLATSKGQKWGWGAYPTLILVVSGVLSLALFVVIENEVDHPLINLHTLGYWAFARSALIISVLLVSLTVTGFYLPLFLQTGLGLTPLNAGLLMLPEALMLAVLMPVAGKIYDRFGPRWPALVGLTISAAGTYLLTGINVDMTRAEVIAWTLVSHQSAQLTADQGALPRRGDLPPAVQQFADQGPTGLYSLYQQLQLHVQAIAYADVFLIAAALTGACVLLAVTLRKPAPAAAPSPTAEPPRAPVVAPAAVPAPTATPVPSGWRSFSTRRYGGRLRTGPWRGPSVVQ